jgi:hypothetical protein
MSRFINFISHFQSRLLWIDPKNVGWKERTAYRWLLRHRPDIGLIRLRLYNGNKLVVDSGNIYDSTLSGGRLGMFCFSQEAIIWSNVLYKCNGECDRNYNNRQFVTKLAFVVCRKNTQIYLRRASGEYDANCRSGL